MRLSNFCLIKSDDVVVNRITPLTVYVENTSKCATRHVSADEFETKKYKDDLVDSLLESPYIQIIP